MHGEGTSEALLEAIECCTVLRNVSEQKMADLASANVVQRKLGEKVVHSALGMSYESFVFELRDLARLLAEIQTGDTTAEKAAGRLRGIRGTVVRLADWMGSMEPQAEKFIRDPETRATALAAARAQTVNARRLAASIGRIVAWSMARAHVMRDRGTFYYGAVVSDTPEATSVRRNPSSAGYERQKDVPRPRREADVESTVMKRVEFNMENVEKCQCMVCPVQVGSSWAHDKDRSVQSMMGPGAMGMPSPDSVPRVYWATGTATCGDLDFEQQCQCPKTCEVYRENDLSAWKYCQRGSAAQIG